LYRPSKGEREGFVIGIEVVVMRITYGKALGKWTNSYAFKTFYGFSVSGGRRSGNMMLIRTWIDKARGPPWLRFMRFVCGVVQDKMNQLTWARVDSGG
jgi:hypothetical protein